jgi:hypothetical protein
VTWVFLVSIDAPCAAIGVALTCRFPAPWSIRELEQAFRIEDANGQAVAYTCFRRNENEARQASVLTYDEARRIAANIARLPEKVGKTEPGLCFSTGAESRHL